jgi:membrane protein YdbS with pleckstrin-like domain
MSIPTTPYPSEPGAGAGAGGASGDGGSAAMREGLIQTIDESEFMVGEGFCYLWCLLAINPVCIPFFCCPYQWMKTQRVTLDQRYIRFQADSYLVKVDKMVPLDRIQDVDLNENCMQRCCGIAQLDIQTAGGGKRPEITIFAPKQPKELRDRIMQARDVASHGAPAATVAVPAHETDKLLAHGSSRIAEDQALLDKEFKDMSSSLLRMERLLTQGIQKL